MRFLESLDWGMWAYGLIAGFVGGGATAAVSGVTLNMLDPKDFNVYNQQFYIMVGAIFVSNGLLNALMFLKQNPLPKIVTTTTIEKTETTSPATVVTKVEQTKTEPAPATKEK